MFLSTAWWGFYLLFNLTAKVRKNGAELDYSVSCLLLLVSRYWMHLDFLLPEKTRSISQCHQKTSEFSTLMAIMLVEQQFPHSHLCSSLKQRGNWCLLLLCSLTPSLQILWFVWQWKAKKEEKSEGTGKLRREKFHFPQAALGLTATQLELVCGRQVSEHKSIREKA